MVTTETQEDTAKVLGRDLRISTKYSIEMSRFLKGKSIIKANVLLDGILNKTVAMPVRKFHEGAGHKTSKVGPGKYPQKVALEFKNLINSATKNAVNKGMDTTNLMINNIIVNKGRRQYRNTRRRGISMKLTHVELSVIKAPEVKK